MRLLAHPARPWHLDGDRTKDSVSKNVRLARLHEVAQGKARGADLRLAREAPCHLAEPSKLARRDDVMKALWRASAVMVGSPNRNNWGRRSGSTQPYGFDFLIRLDSFAVRNLAGTTLLTMSLFRPFPLHDRARHQHREVGLQAESCDGHVAERSRTREFLAASPI
jgi:hypothetical protein